MELTSSDFQGGHSKADAKVDLFFQSISRNPHNVLAGEPNKRSRLRWCVLRDRNLLKGVREYNKWGAYQRCCQLLRRVPVSVEQIDEIQNE